MNNISAGIIFFFFTVVSFSQETFTEEDLEINPYIAGTLTTPDSTKNPPLIIFIQGSGPTDRNGNQSMMKNDSSKKIARALAEKGIASFRFDKRIFKMKTLGIKEEDLRLEDFVKDVEEILEFFKRKGEYEDIVVAGHSEGSLIGALAAKGKADAFISLAGAGRSIDKIIVEQIAKQSPQLAENARKAFDEILETGSATDYRSLP